MNLENAILMHHSSLGIYIPQFFAKEVDPSRIVNDEDGILKGSLERLKEGPESEFYWDDWDHVLYSAVIRSKAGDDYILYQDGDLWAVPLNDIHEEDQEIRNGDHGY